MLGRALHEHVSWLEAASYSRATVRSRRRNLALFSNWCDARGIADPGDLTVQTLESYRRSLYESLKANGEPLGSGDQTQKLLAVKMFCRWAARMRVIAEDVGAGLQLPRRPQHLPRAILSRGDVDRVLMIPDVTDVVGLRDRAILETLYSTGMRRMELIGLRLSDVDPERGVVLIREGKGKRDRMVPVGARALAWIELYVAKARPQFVRINHADVLFVTRRGNRVRENRLTELVHRYLARAGLAQAGSCHLFRHTVATHMLENGADIRYLQALLGHAQLSTTAIYAQVSIVGLKEVYERTHPHSRTGAVRTRQGSM